MDHIYKQPKYFREFKCIGGDCPESCCDGWNIDWKTYELDKLKSADGPDWLKELIESSFVFKNDNDFYSVKLCEDGRCPFHNRDSGLCDIQRTIGENYLGVICTQYPRHYIEQKNQIIRWCATSCPSTIDLLIKNEDAVDIELTLARDYKKLDHSTVITDNAEAIKLDPVKQVRLELFDFYTEMLLDKSRDFETSIILNALAVKHLTEAEKSGDFRKMPPMTISLKHQLNDPAVARSLGEIKPNYQLMFKLVNNMLYKFFGNNSRAINISALHDGNQLIVENYLHGIENFNNAFDNKPFVLKNVIMNTFFDMNLPLGKFRRSLFENYSFFVLAAAAFKTVAASIGFSSENIKEDFKICISQMSRSFSHDIQKADKIIIDMLETGITSPAHLALIIKG